MMLFGVINNFFKEDCFVFVSDQPYCTRQLSRWVDGRMDEWIDGEMDEKVGGRECR